MKSVSDKSLSFSHMKSGEAQRDLTSAVCAFRLVSGTKTWPVNQHALAPLGHT